MADPTATCLLCGGPDNTPVHVLQVADIVRLYRRVLDIDVAGEFDGQARITFRRCRICGLRFFSPPAAGSEALYEKLQRFDWYYQADKPEYRYAASHVGKDQRVLEVGCGRGAFADWTAGADYTGLETNEQAKALAGSGHPDILIETVEQHAERHAADYDVVCGFQVLEHVPDPAAFLRACVDCLRAGGTLILSVPNADGFLALLRNNPLNMPPHHVTWWGKDAFVAAADAHDLAITDIHEELLDDIHRHMYAAGLAAQAVDNILGIPYNMLDVSLTGRVRRLFSSALARLLVHGLRSREMRPRGHSMTVVLEKVGSRTGATPTEGGTVGHAAPRE